MSAKPVDPMQAYRDAVRAGGFNVTPWRLGVEVGMAHAFTPRDEPANPYVTAKSRKLFTEGVRNGRERARQERRAARAGGAL